MGVFTSHSMRNMIVLALIGVAAVQPLLGHHGGEGHHHHVDDPHDDSHGFGFVKRAYDDADLEINQIEKRSADAGHGYGYGHGYGLGYGGYGLGGHHLWRRSVDTTPHHFGYGHGGYGYGHSYGYGHGHGGYGGHYYGRR